MSQRGISRRGVLPSVSQCGIGPLALCACRYQVNFVHSSGGYKTGQFLDLKDKSLGSAGTINAKAMRRESVYPKDPKQALWDHIEKGTEGR